MTPARTVGALGFETSTTATDLELNPATYTNFPSGDSAAWRAPPIKVELATLPRTAGAVLVATSITVKASASIPVTYTYRPSRDAATPNAPVTSVLLAT